MQSRFDKTIHHQSKSSLLTSDLNVKFSILDQDDIDETVQCLADAFSEDDPTTYALNITAAEFKVFSKYICEKVLEHRLSLVARDNTNGKLIGCRIVEPIEIKNKDVPHLSEKFLPIFALLKEVTATQPMVPAYKRVAHFITLAIDKNYRGRNLAKQLLALQLHFLTQLGYEYFCAEFTNPYSYLAIKSVLDGDILHSHEIEYQTFKYENEYPFAGLKGKVVACLNPVNALKLSVKEWARQQQIDNWII